MAHSRDQPSFAKAAGAMSGMSRFLSKRDRSRNRLSRSHEQNDTKSSGSVSGPSHAKVYNAESAADFYGLFYDKSKPPSKDEEAQIKTIKQKLLEKKGVMLKDGQLLWALRSQLGHGDVESSQNLLFAISDASEGIVTPFNPSVALKGAVNNQMVTCFLDSTLFSMFSRLDSFEAMLYNSFDDVAKERLAFLLRLWVNLLRSGQLIPTEVTREVQESLAQCGWAEAREMHQQDASEAFTFITEKLNLPLLTLKMDIYHTGKQDNDDHKFINERLLEVAIPTLENGDYPKEIRLEDCLEEYFNNRIEVKRYLERRSTLQTVGKADKAREAGMSVHVETTEIDPEALTPLTPISPIPSYMSDRPNLRHRAASIIQERYFPDSGEVSSSPKDEFKTPLGRLRTGSVRKEVLMPAWQFFSLIPWYTDNAPSNDAQVAAHFSSKRPMLGLCLKRYSYTMQGRAMRLSTFVDIPIEIALPHFIQDDQMVESGPLFGNFKLSLQSLVCHRGNSVDSGHYIAVVRSPLTYRESEQETPQWLKFDDLANPRVTITDIHKVLAEETPYLLFYQIQPVDGDPGNLTSGEKPSSVPTTASPSTRPISVASGDPLASVDGETAVTSLEEDRGRLLSDGRRPSTISFSDSQPGATRKSVELARDGANIERKKSSSFNNGLTKTLSILGSRSRKDSKEEMPHIQIQEVQSEDNSKEPEMQLDPVRSKSDPGTPLPAVNVSKDGSTGIGRSHSKREKSRSRRLKSGKTRDDPDRECLVM